MTAKAPQYKPDGLKKPTPPPAPPRYSDHLDLTMGKIEVFRDEIAEKLDELADLCYHWRRNREKNIQPNGIRAGIFYLIDEILLLAKSLEEGA